VRLTLKVRGEPADPNGWPMKATAPSAEISDAVSAELDDDQTRPIRVLRPCADHADVDHLSRLAALGAAVPAVLSELASPMQVMGGVEIATELVADGPAAVREAGERAVAAWRRAEALFGALRRVVRGGDLLRRDVEIDRILAQVLDRVGDNRRRIPVIAAGAAGARVLVCEPLVVHAAVELARNAVRASPPTGEVRLDVEIDVERVALRVVDAGPGAPALATDHVASPLSALDAGQAGVGLIAVALIAELHGGALEHERAHGRGSCFVLRLPRHR
jgi:signal transduction histidine kinase